MHVVVAMRVMRFRAICGVGHKEDWLVGLGLVTYDCLNGVAIGLIC